jgi:hypothetical protein
LFVVLPLLASCLNADEPAPDPIQLSITNDRGQVLSSVGQETQILLQSIGPWEYGDPIVSSNAMHFLGAEQQGLPNAGGPRLLYRFVAVSEGEVQIEIPRPALPNDPPNLPPREGFHLTVIVTHAPAP